jgi:hypothetical protein
MKLNGTGSLGIVKGLNFHGVVTSGVRGPVAGVPEPLVTPAAQTGDRQTQEGPVGLAVGVVAVDALEIFKRQSCIVYGCSFRSLVQVVPVAGRVKNCESRVHIPVDDAHTIVTGSTGISLHAEPLQGVWHHVPDPRSGPVVDRMTQGTLG